MTDLEFLRGQLEKANLIPYSWEGEDKNLGAFRSKGELVEWYSQPPGVVNQPYRDRAFYTRELAMLSRMIGPRTIEEFGTSLGIGTCLLHWLNPNADLVTVDVNTETFLPGDVRVPMGYLAKYQRIPARFVTGRSWDFADVSRHGVDLCFIDAEHTYDAVLNDSDRAWHNRSMRFAIAWHDYNDRHPGVVAAVDEFCEEQRMELHVLPDSDTVWIEG